MPTRKTKTAAKKKTATKAATPKKSTTQAAAARRPAKKAPVKKTAQAKQAAPAKKTAAAKKAAPKKAVKKTAAQPTKAAAKKAAPKKAATKPASSKKAAKTPAAQKSVTTASAAPAKKATAGPSKEKAVLDARKRKQTPSVFKIRNRRNTPIVFTLDDVKEILDKRRQTAAETKEETAKTKAAAKKATVAEDMPQENRVLGAASLADILGFNPAGPRQDEVEAESIAPKFKKFHKALIELRDRVRDGLNLHTSETLRKSSKDESGDLSGYGQHMADAGSDSADRDFALSLVSNEQELLYEIEEALKRIRNGTYGNCEITGEPIDKERLLAVPFTRHSLEGQRQLESNRRRSRAMVGGGIFSDASEESSLTEDEGDS